MPHAAEFLTGFGFILHKDYSGFILTKLTSSHIVIKQYHEYRYDIVLEFKGTGPFDSLSDSLVPLIVQEHIIYGVRNPYRCIIDAPKPGDIIQTEYDTYVIKLTGHSYRVYH